MPSLAVGLDTVSFIENHYVVERGLSPQNTVDYLKREYLDQGKLGLKCPLGGLYPPIGHRAQEENGDAGPRIIALDTGLSATTPSLKSGEIIELTRDGKVQRVLVRDQSLPDGLAVDTAIRRMFWTCMGVPGETDGTVHSANLDGSDIQTLVTAGTINTPKQLTIDAAAKQVYFSDREGLRVFRCRYDGSNLELLIESGQRYLHGQDATRWCVGIAVAPRLGKFY